MKSTPGPWEWFVDGSGRIYLGTPNRGRLIVMDCVRSGMQRAVPRFAVWKGDERERMGGIMVPADEIELANHPDARLIAAAPDLLAACEAAIRYDEKMMDVASAGHVDLRAAGGGIATGDDLDALYEDWMCKAREALKKARGE